MRKPKVGERVKVFIPKAHSYITVAVVRKLNPKRETYEYEVETLYEQARGGFKKGERLCYNAHEMRFPDA